MVASWVMVAPAQAQSPAGCIGNRFQADLLKDRTFIRDGETVNYRILIANNAAGACDASNVTLRFQLPSATGAPSPTFTTLFTAANFASGFREQTFGPFAFTPVFGATPPARYTARQTKASGVVHDVPAPGSDLNIDRDLQVLTVQPGLTIDKTGSTTGGPAPQSVVYTYTVRNVTLPAGLPDDVSQMQNVVPTDDLCAPLTLVSGDTNGDAKMQIAETWTYTCGQTFPNPGVFTNTVKVCADEVADRIVKNYCSPPDTWTVTVTPPPPAAPPAPQAGVKPANATQAPCDIASPTGLNVRARELTTIRVKVRNVDAGTEARITLPGGKVLKAKVNSAGTATFKVRPTKSGRATIRIAECGDVARFTVKSPRQVQTRQVPRVTG
ncbi:hypothetical protein OJ998_11870 [Solirubrobacter taibaiensis]|nr:hypothetical protein [Solirubrobacter taibaiensis]